MAGARSRPPAKGVPAASAYGSKLLIEAAADCWRVDRTKLPELVARYGEIQVTELAVLALAFRDKAIQEFGREMVEDFSAIIARG